MVTKTETKLYAFVDESGQETAGKTFVVGVLVLDTAGLAVKDRLEAVERESGKGSRKWNGTRYDYRKAYVEGVAAIPKLRKRLFYESFSDTKQYFQLTSFT